MNSQQATHFQAHFECARQLYNALLAEHIDSLMAQKLASRAYQAANRVCVGQARQVRFRGKGRRLDSVEGKTNSSGLSFHLQAGADGNEGWLSWNGDQIPALIEWEDEVVHHGLQQRIKYVRLIRHRASSPQAQGADCHGFSYSVQLILEGHPLQKPKNLPGKGTVGLDLGPSTVAIVSGEGKARLLLLAEELAPDGRERRRLQRRLERQRRANNAEHYDEKGRIRTRCKGQGRRMWRESQGYQKTRRRLATTRRASPQPAWQPGE